MKKIYYRPTHIVDTSLVIFILDRDKLTLERLPVAINMIRDHSDSNFLNEFEEVTQQQFLEICEKQATKESTQEFMKKYNDIFT